MGHGADHRDIRSNISVELLRCCVLGMQMQTQTLSSRGREAGILKPIDQCFPAYSSPLVAFRLD